MLILIIYNHTKDLKTNHLLGQQQNRVETIFFFSVDLLVEFMNKCIAANIIGFIRRRWLK